MRAELDWRLAGEPMTLLGERALYWPARRRLLIADLHLGKADVFRRAGIGLPSGGTALDLQRLAALLQAQDAQELWILGDVLHGAAPAAAWQRDWHAWRAAHPQLRVAAIAGNHDRALAGAGLDIALLGEQVEDGPFALRHDPAPHPHLHVLCGHLHPLAKLPGMRQRWPAFWLRERMTVLPAFSQFTAGVVPILDPDERLVVCVEGATLALPAAMK
ncbi:ligase-associated DNA damage response endonuclease PdeM [Xanthomonas campestris pv. phormiicola]|nr:ligase-associated DNA damage response endonuclease PdeM [Xanthomonas campestris pv. phormiicola]UYC15044.1 ligase-associated DNA damage response endonuclease PdeM [Xanthomonas campestris pv. phormiicola]